MSSACSHQSYPYPPPAPKAQACTCTGASTALISAAEAGCLECCAKFKEQAGKVIDGTTALIQAAKHGRTEVVRLLIPLEAKIQDKDGQTALHFATLNGRPEIAKLLIKHEAGMTTSTKTTALMLAAENGHLDLVGLLFPRQIRMVDIGGRNALVHAVQAQQVDAVKLLLPHESDITDSVGKTPADYAFRTDCAELWRIFDKDITEEKIILLQAAHKTQCRCGAKSTSLIEAAGEGCVRCCAVFIRKAGKAVAGTTALIVAAKKGFVEVVRLLIPHEAKMQAEDGKTALMYAVERNQIEIVELMIPYEAKMKKEDGWTALMSSALHNHLEVVKLLIPHEVKMQTNNGWTAFQLAAFYGKTESVRLLVPHEAKMTQTNGWTALMLSAMNGHSEIVQLLLPYEAGLQLSNGSTATLIAVPYFQPECFAILYTNENERDAIQIPEVMLSACRGDIQGLVACQKEWKIEYNDLTALDFALLGGERRTVKPLAESKQLQAFFSAKIVPHLVLDGTNALNFLSSHEHLLREILPIISIATAHDRSGLLLKALLEGVNGIRVLRAICTPVPEPLFEHINVFRDDAKAVKVLSSLKCIGFSHDGKTASDLAQKPDGSVSQYIQSNPLRQKQIALAPREAELPDIKQPAWREVEVESAFNRALLLESRDIAKRTKSTRRFVQTRNTNHIAYQHALNRRLLLDFARSMQKIVQGMLDE